jgi:hypothetical protein
MVAPPFYRSRRLRRIAAKSNLRYVQLRQNALKCLTSLYKITVFAHFCAEGV